MKLFSILGGLCFLVSCFGNPPDDKDGSQFPELPASTLTPHLTPNIISTLPLSALDQKNTQIAKMQAAKSARLTLTPPQLTKTSTGTPTSTLTPTITPTPYRLPDSLAGLIFRQADALWQLEKGGHFSQLFEHPFLILSQDGTSGLYQENEDIFVVDLEAGTSHNLTNTPDRLECCPRWWGAEGEKVLFGSWPDYYLPAHSLSGFNMGFISIVDTTGENYRILDETQPFYNWLAANETSSYAIFGANLWVDAMNLNGEFQEYALTMHLAQLLPTQEIRISELPLKMRAPVLAPNGTQIFGYASEQAAHLSNRLEKIVLWDLENNSMKILHEYEVYGTDANPPYPVISPDGTMLAFFARNDDREARGLWVIELSTGEILFQPHTVRPLNCSWEIIWRPDSSQIACAEYVPEGKRFWLIDVQEGMMEELFFPEDTALSAWR